jgi:hypothetical protein
VEVADLTVGIGADLIALLRRGGGEGFELDSERLAIAKWNLSVHDCSATIVQADSSTCAWSGDFAWCDPSRRSEGRRLRSLGDFSPDPRGVGVRMTGLELGGIKLSPMLRDDELEGFGGGLDFVSFGGECREAVVWLGSAAAKGRHAVRVDTGDRLAATPLESTVDSASRIIFEADPAAIRAHALGAFGLSGLGDSNGYLTADHPVDSPWLRRYDVLEDHPADERRTRATLRAQGGGTPVVKARAKDVDVVKLRQLWRGEGEELTVIVYPVGPKIRHAIVRPTPEQLG